MKPFGQELRLVTPDSLFEWAHRLESLTLEAGLVRIRGLGPLDRGTFLEFAREIGKSKSQPFIEWDFGPVMELKEDPASPNYLFSQEAVPYHWDGAFHEVPGILLFNCIEPPASGGETLFVDTQRLVESLTPPQRQLAESMRFAYLTEKKAHYGGKFSQNLVQVHPITGKPTLRLGESVVTEKNPVTRVEEHTPTEERAALIREIEQRLYDPQFQLATAWEAGDIVLADNHRLLHGRNRFTSHGTRHIRRIQLR